MRKLVLSICLLLFSLFISSAQELPDLKKIKLNKRAHYKEVEPLVLKVTDYLFATPADTKNNSRQEAGQFLIRWMNDTPFITFRLEEKETNFFNTDSELMLMYMAALCKFTLEHQEEKQQNHKIKGAMLLVIPYLEQQEIKKSWSNSLWQLVDAYKRGKIDDFLASNVY